MNTDKRLLHETAEAVLALRGPTDSETLVIASKLAATYRTAGEWPSVAQEAWQLLRGYCRQGQGQSAALPHGMGDRLARLLVGRECARSFTEEECVVVNELIVWALKLPHAPDAPADSAGHAWSDADVRECAALMEYAEIPKRDLASIREWAAEIRTNSRAYIIARAALDFAASRLSAQRPASADARVAELEASANYCRAVAEKMQRDNDYLRAALAELQSAREGESPSPRPTVEQLVEVGLQAWRGPGLTAEDVIKAVARAVLAADAPAVALPEGLREKAQEIAGRLPDVEMLDFYRVDGRDFYNRFGAAQRNSLADAVALVRELAAQP